MNARERNDEIILLREDGALLQEIGDKYGISRERVRQIVGKPARPNDAFSDRDRRLGWLKTEAWSWARAEKFWSRVLNRGAGCWYWEGPKILGYGHLTWKIGKCKYISAYAHRIAWLLWHGSLPEGPRYGNGTLQVLHKCDNPSCVNPDHLFLGTIADNMHDRDSKGRDKFSQGKYRRAQHGSYSMYTSHGCRCPECRNAATEYRKRRKNR